MCIGTKWSKAALSRTRKLSIFHNFLLPFGLLEQHEDDTLLCCEKAKVLIKRYEGKAFEMKT